MSDPAATVTATTVSATASRTSGTTAPASTTPGATGGHTGTPPLTKIFIQALTFNLDCNWPVELKLDSSKDNWQEWNKHLCFLCDQCRFRPYLNSTLAQPNESLHFEAACAWDTSDMALHSFISQHISNHNYDIIGELPSAFEMYNTLRKIHQKFGPYVKIKTIRAILDTVFPPHRTTYCQTFDNITRLQS